MSAGNNGPVEVLGEVARGFESVRDAFVENFRKRHELGGACSAYCGGQRVVDLWGGVRDVRTGAPWEEDTMVIVHSATKGLAAMTLALAHSRGWLDYEERVCTYWPEFAQQGKERITVRQLLAHQAGLFAIDEPVDRSVSRISIDWPRCWLGRSRPGSQARGRPITRSVSDSTRENCCAASIRGTERSGSSSTGRLRPDLVKRCTSVFRRRFRMTAWPDCNRLGLSPCSSGFRCAFSSR